MTPDLVSLEVAKTWLRVDHSADDTVIALLIRATSRAVLNYIGDAQYQFLDTSGEFLLDTDFSPPEEIVPEDIRLAVLTHVADRYKNREKTEDPVASEFGYGYLPQTVTALLYAYRTPTIA